MTILNKFLIFRVEKKCLTCNFDICPVCNGTKKVISTSTGTGIFSFVIGTGVVISGIGIFDPRTEVIWHPIIFFIVFSIIGLLTLKEYKEQK